MYCKDTLLLLLLLLVSAITAGAADSPTDYVWIEAEKYDKCNFPHFEKSSMGKPQLLSGGEWLMRGLKSDEVIMALGLGTFEELSVRLEEADIIVDCVGRMGTQEVTRLGMKEPQMERIADLVCRVMIDRDEPSLVREEVHRFRSEYTEPQFSLP